MPCAIAARTALSRLRLAKFTLNNSRRHLLVNERLDLLSSHFDLPPEYDDSNGFGGSDDNDPEATTTIQINLGPDENGKSGNATEDSYIEADYDDDSDDDDDWAPL